MTNVDAEVKRCAEIMARNHQAELDELFGLLVSGDVSEIEAEALLALVPIGFAHALLSDMGVELPDAFLVRNPETGECVRALLGDDAIFQSAKRLGRTMLTARSSLKDAVSVVTMSSEWATVRSLCPEGNDFSGCVLGESVLMRVPLGYLTNNGARASS